MWKTGNFHKGKNKIKLQIVHIFLFAVLLKIFTNVMLAVPLKMHGRGCEGKVLRLTFPFTLKAHDKSNVQI
jgi:hypothetical protein